MLRTQHGFTPTCHPFLLDTHSINPLEAEAPQPSAISLNPPLALVSESTLFMMLLGRERGGYPGDNKFLYVVCSNPVNQYPNVNV
jgi:hypothetical protein